MTFKDCFILFMVALVFVGSIISICVQVAALTHRPKDYRVEYGVTYWTDQEGHRMMEDRNGNVRQLTTHKQGDSTHKEGDE